MHIQALLLDTPAFNYQLHWSFLPCALRARNTAIRSLLLLQTNSFAAALLLLFLC
jgi:hypothetical protein